MPPADKKKTKGKKNTRASVVKYKEYTPNIGLPLKKRVKLTYVDHVAFSSSGVSHAGYQFRMNSLLDPQYAVGGHQPYGRDQWATLYNRYNVISCKLTARFRQLAGANVPVVVGAFMDKDLVLPLALTTKVEQAKGHGLSILNINTNSTAVSTAYYDRDKWFDKKSEEYDDQNALMNANPATDAVCEVWVQSIDGATAVATNTIGLIQLEYWVELSEPIEFGAS